MFEGKTIAFIGCGNMGEAMVRGLLAQKVVAATQIIASDPRAERGAELTALYGIRTTTDNVAAADEAAVLILAVKPQILPFVMPAITGRLSPTDLILSIMAGSTIETIRNGTQHEAIVRSMPNTPGQIGEGMSVWTKTDAVSDAQHQQAATILESMGKAVYVTEERYIDMATAISGSGPGFVFLMLEAMIDAGVHLGFARDVAEQLVIQTVRGSAAYAAESELHLAELRNRVTSPAGTTAAGLYQLEKGGLRTVLASGIWGAYDRAVALGQGQKVDQRR